MNKIEIDCPGCGAKIPVTVGDGHKSIAKCDCGATTYVKADGPGDKSQILLELNKLMSQAPALIEALSASKRKGLDSGVDQAVHDAALRVAADLIRNDEELSEAFRDMIRNSLEAAFLHDCGGHGGHDCEGGHGGHEGEEGGPA